MSRGPALSGFNSSKKKRKEQAKISRLVTKWLDQKYCYGNHWKRIKKSFIFQHCFGKILLNKVYNCVLCYLTSSFVIEKWIDKNIRSFLSDEFFNFHDGDGSVLDSQHYIHPWQEEEKTKLCEGVHRAN